MPSRKLHKPFPTGRHSNKNKRHAGTPRAKGRLLLEGLEVRAMLAAFTDVHPTLTLTLAQNDAVAIVANPSTYTLKLTSGTWTGSDDGNVSGNGTATLTVQEASFNQVNLTDTGAGTSVTFNDSGSNPYASSFNIALTNAAAESIAFNGATSFTLSNALSASTSGFVVANSGASITTVSGGITLSANQQVTPIGGTFVGININNATVQSATGAITLQGKGGNAGSSNYGVEIQAAGKVQATGLSPALLSITGSTNDGASPAITFNNGAVSSTGNVSLTGANGSITEAATNAGADVTGATVALTTTGSGNQIGTVAPVGGLSTPLQVNATTLLNASTADGFISLKNTSGNMPLGMLNAGAALIELTAVGAITDGNNGAGSPNLTAADGAVLTTTGSSSAIGTSSDPIRTSIGALTATANDGGVYISDSNGPGLFINSVLANEKGQVPFIDGSNNIVVFDPLASPSDSPTNPHAGTKDVSITAKGPILLNTVNATRNVTITSTGGGILDMTTAANNILAQSENLVSEGTANFLGTVTFAQNSAGDTLTRSSGSWVTDGFQAGQEVIVHGAQTAGNDAAYTIQSVSSTVLVLNVVNTVTAETDAGVTVENGTIGLAENPVESTVETFSASTTSGGVFLKQGIVSTAVSVVAGGSGDVSVASIAQSLGIQTITAGGDVTVNNSVGSLLDDNNALTKISGQNVDLTGTTGIGTAADPLQTSTTGTLSGTATKGLMGSTPAAAVYINNTDNPSSVAASTDDGGVTINFTGGDLLFDAATHVLSETGTPVVSFATASGDVHIGALSAASSISAAGAIALDSGGVINGDAVTLTAGTGIGVSGNPIDTNVNSLSATTTTGDVFIQQQKAFSVSASTTSGDVDVRNTAGNMTLGLISASGAVTLRSGGAILDGNGGDVNVTGDSLDAGASNGIGSVSDALETTVNSLTADGGAGGGVAIANGQSLTLTSAAATGGAVSITAIGDLDVGSVTAAGQAVTLTASGGALIDPSGPALNVTAQSAALSGSSIGSSSDPFETQVSSLTATGTNGGIYISDLGTGTITLAATATGLGSNIVFTSAGSIALNAVTAKGNTVTLTSTNPNGTITTAIPQPPVNITAQTLDIVASGGIGTSANPLEILVAQIAAADGGTPGVFMNNAGPVSIVAGALEAPGSGTLSFDAASITIQDLGTTPVSLAAGRSLLLKTETGPIVFLNQANTIQTSGAGRITVEAGTTPGSGGLAVLGNLTTGGGNILVTADGNVTFGLLNAGTGNVTVQSATGILLDGNGPSNVNVIAGSATLSGNAPTARQLQLNEENAIAAAAAASAETASEQTSANAFDSQVASINGAVGTDQATVGLDQQAYNTAKSNADSAAAALLGLRIAQLPFKVAKTALDFANIIAEPIAAAAQAIPLTGDFGAAEVKAVIADAKVAVEIIVDSFDVAIVAQNEVTNNLKGIATTDKAQLFGAQATLASDQATQSAFMEADSIAQAAAGNALLQSETAAVVSNQAIAATDQGNVIGSTTDPLGIQVTGVVNVTAGPTDSFLQVVGNTALGQIQATGGVTLISTGAITNGALPGVPNIVATGLTITAVNGIGTAGNPLLTRVGTLNATDTGSGDIVISNTYGTGAALNITGISNTGGGNVVVSNTGNAAAGQGITVSGPIGATGAGTVAINSGSPLTINANVTSASAITLSAAESPAAGDDLTVDPGVTIQSTTSSVTLQAGDNVTVPIGATVEAATAITITADHNHTAAETTGANVVVEGTLIAPSALINVDPSDTNADTFTITPSTAPPITVTGGAGSDTLNFNADGLPVTIAGNQITAAGRAPVTFSSIEAVHITNAAAGGSITLDAAAGLNDAMILTGTGPGAGTFTLNGGTPISFSGVNTFAYNGAAQNEAITLSPFATPLQQWNVAVTINGGGAGKASLTYNNVAGVSDNLTIQPSAPATGQLIDNNAATGTSIAVVTYVHTNNFVVNGSTGATTDNLFINGTAPANPGTSGNDDALANFQATGDVTHPMVRVYDAGAGAVGVHSPSSAELADTAGTAASDLFNLQSLTNFSTIHIGLLGGNDVLDVAGAQSGALASLAIDYAGGTGDDNLIVDSTNGPVLGPINYDGGPGTNSMTLTGGTATSDTFIPGAQLGAGTNTLVINGGTESVSFQNLAPIFDQVAGPLAVNGNNANNAITYQEGNDRTSTLNPAWGQVSVDNLEPINFTNKTTLAIAGLAGTDTFSLNNPNTPTSLSSVAVSGSSSTGFDALIVNGVGATVGIDTAARKITGASGAVPITYDTIGALTVNAGPSTGLAVSNSNTFVYTPGLAADAGTVQTSTLPITFTGLGAGKTLTLTGSGAGASLVANDPTANDAVTLAATSGNVTTLAPRATIGTASIPNLTLNGLNGVDTFNVAGPQPYSSITLAGGGAAVANLNGNGTDVIANLGGAPASVSGGGLGTVSLPGIATLNLNAGAGNITLAGTSGTDAFTVTPTGANTATAQVGGLAPAVNTTNTGNLTVDAGVGTDTLAVNGTSAPDTINVSGTAVTVVGLKPVNYTNVESLQVNGLAGSDTFNVTSSATVPISIDGGDPVGVLPGDLLNVITNPGDTATFGSGPTSDQGGFVVNNNQPISFVHIESLSVSGGGTPVINGTNGNDVINIVARDSSYASNADGIQDFTVSVNSAPNVLFVNTPSLKVNGQAGNNQIVLQTPAPNLAAWNVAVTIDGGIPSISDQLVVVAPGTTQATYAPAFNGGTLGITNSKGTVANVTFTDLESFIYDGQAGGDTFTVVGNSGANLFTLTPGAANDAGALGMDSTLPVTFQNLGTSGQVVVNGNGGADSLVYNGTAANDAFVINSSALGGQVNLNARVPVLTQNIPTLSLEGLAGDDTFTLVPTIAADPFTTLNLDGGATASATGNQANLTAAASAALSISGQTIKQGTKTVAGTSLQNINLNGANDDLTINYVPGVTEAFNVISSPTAGQGQVSIPNVALWSFTAVPFVYVNGNTATNDTLTFTGTLNSDVFNANLNAAGTDADPVLQLTDATAKTLLTLGNFTGFSQLNIYGLDGADTFNVYTGPTVSRNLYINGNLPSGKKKLTNVMNVFYQMPKPKIVQSTATQNPSSGSVSLNYGSSNDLIQFDGIQNVIIRKQ